MKQEPISKTPNRKKGWQSGSTIEHLSSKCEALSLNSGTAKNKKNFLKQYVISE
jgi:hypothetical protein